MPKKLIEARAQAFSHRLSKAEWAKKGRQLRKDCARHDHAQWNAHPSRPDPVEIVKRADAGRIPELVPIRHSRMLQSPFAFYRGSALAMAIDLATLPRTGAYVHACGDVHLGNFGCFATPERRIVFDINDLDETLPAPWEWDVKRLAVSFVMACRSNGISDANAKDVVQTCIEAYRRKMADFCTMSVRDVWYASMDAEGLLAKIKSPELRARGRKQIAKALARSALDYDFPKLVETKTTQPKIKDNPPLIYHLRDNGHKEFTKIVQNAFRDYRTTLQEDRQLLLDRYEFKDIAIKVVGVGSVASFCAVILLMASDNDPLFLQVKQAFPSVLEPFAGKSIYPNHGQRVVTGYRLMQSASDVFLGWTEGRFNRQFYIRQLRDAKIKFAVDSYGTPEMEIFAKWCGECLARAHARTGEPSLLAGYLGDSDKFAEAVAKFAMCYADQVERDFDVVSKAAKLGKLSVAVERE